MKKNKAKEKMTGKTAQPATRVRRGHKLTVADAEAICELVALRANEREACAALSIPYSTWNHFKAKPRNQELLAGILDRIRGAKIKAHLDNVEGFSRKDWRASIAYLEKILPEKFSAKIELNESPRQPIIVNMAIVDERLEQLLKQKQARDLAEGAAQKQLPPANPENETPGQTI